MRRDLHRLVPLPAMGIVLAFRQWYFLRFGGLFAKSFGVLALIAPLVSAELLLLVVWEAVSERPLTYEVWFDEHADPDLAPEGRSGPGPSIVPVSCC